MIAAWQQFPLLWKGKEFTAEHDHACSCLTNGKQGVKYDRLHSFRIVGKHGYVFTETTPWVVRYAISLWSEDDPFMESEPLDGMTGGQHGDVVTSGESCHYCGGTEWVCARADEAQS